MDMNEKIQGMIADFAKKLIGVVEKSAQADAKEAAKAELLAKLGGDKPAKQASSGRGHYKRPKQCKTDGCSRRNKGPRFGFMCDEHKPAKAEGEMVEATPEAPVEVSEVVPEAAPEVPPQNLSL